MATPAPAVVPASPDTIDYEEPVEVSASTETPMVVEGADTGNSSPPANASDGEEDVTMQDTPMPSKRSARNKNAVSPFFISLFVISDFSNYF